jgi:hypothetical protein
MSSPTSLSPHLPEDTNHAEYGACCDAASDESPGFDVGPRDAVDHDVSRKMCPRIAAGLRTAA